MNRSDHLKEILKIALKGYDHRRDSWKTQNPFINTEYEFGYEFNSPYRIGILFDLAHQHHFNIQACIEEEISYQVIDITKDNWLEAIQQANCHGLVGQPIAWNRVWKQLYEDRLYVIEEILKFPIIPSFKETWFYESKRRSCDWLKAHQLPHPQTYVFYDRSEAQEFLDQCTYPIVFKSDLGAGSKGVQVCRDQRTAIALMEQCFKGGFRTPNTDLRDKQWGYVLFQTYLEDASEWRLVRVGDSFFCRIKGKVGDYHSGSGKMSWGTPPPELLNDFKKLTDDHQFHSMNIDYFEDKHGNYYINELHTVFGEILEKNIDQEDPLMGRYLWNSTTSDWEFENGFFYRNACANMRIQHLIKLLSTP